MPRPIVDVRLDTHLFGDAVFVVYDYMTYPQAEPIYNLIAYDFNASLIWTISEHPMPRSPIAYTGFFHESDFLGVGNFAGLKCRIDLETGRLIESEFTK